MIKITIEEITLTGREAIESQFKEGNTLKNRMVMGSLGIKVEKENEGPLRLVYSFDGKVGKLFDIMQKQQPQKLNEHFEKKMIEMETEFRQRGAILDQDYMMRIEYG